MRCGDLETLKRMNLNVILVVFNDKGLGTIKIPRKMKKYNCGGLDFACVDYIKLAEAFGLQGISVKTHREFKDGLKGALSAKTSTLIEVRVNSETYDSFIKEIRQNMQLAKVSS